MPILHAKSITIADGTDTGIVRPSDWLSSHNVQYNLSGNTAGSSAVSGADVVFVGGNNVTLSADTANSRLVISGPNTAAQTAFVFSNSNGVTFGTNASTVTASVATNYAGTAFATTTVAGSVVAATHNTAGLTLAVPAYLTTTAAQTVQPVAFSASGGSSAFSTLSFSNQANGVTFSNSAGQVALSHSLQQLSNTSAITSNAVATGNSSLFLLTANATSKAGNGTTFGGTNISGSMTLNSNGLALSLSGGGGGVINQTGPNIAVAGSTVTSGDVYFSNSPTVTFGMNGSTITASAAGGGGGGGVTIGGAELFQLNNATNFTTLGNNTIYFQRFINQSNVSFNNIERRVSMSTASSSIVANANYTIDYGMYSRGTGTNNTKYDLIASSQLIVRASYSSNVSAGYTLSQGAGSVTQSSAGTVMMSALSGFKHMYMPFTSTISAGGEYAVAMRVSSATTGNTGPLRIGWKDMTNYTNLSIGRVDVNNGGISISNVSRVGEFAQGVYSVTSSNLPASIALTGFTNQVLHARMYIQFDV